MSDKHIEVLTKNISALNDALEDLRREETLRKILEIIHRHPGWTTPAEFAFATSLVKAMNIHVSAIQSLQKEFLSASELVAEQKAPVSG